MTTITLPASPRAASDSWKLVMPTQTNISGWTGARTTLASGRGWWECSYSLPPMTPAQFRSWRSFLSKMRGQANETQVPIDGGRAQYPAPNLKYNAALSLDFENQSYYSEGGSNYTPRVNGASQTGRSLTTDGWDANKLVLREGDLVTINNQLLQITADVTSSSSGSATISFEPPIRTSPADNTAIEFRQPYALMYIEETPGWTHDLGPTYGLQINFREAF